MPNIGPISKKIIDGLKKVKNQKIINFSEFKEAKAYAQDLDKEVISGEELSKYDPLHAVYIYAQNKASVLVEQLSKLKLQITRLFQEIKSSGTHFLIEILRRQEKMIKSKHMNRL